MLETKYYKDYRHNYLILKDNGCLSENVYQRKMMTENKISGLLQSSEKHINGELLIYYEITSKQSLQSYFSGRNIGMGFLKKFFVQLKRVSDVLQKYLLDGSCMVLLPEYIFVDVGTEDMYFLYYPSPEEGSLSDLMNFFISGIDNEDMEAVETVYKIADLIQKEQFVLDEVLEWFQDDCLNCADKAGFWSEQKEQESSLQEENAEESSGWKNNDKQEDAETKREKIIKAALPAAIAVIGAGVLAYVMHFYRLSYTEKIYLVAGWGIVILVLSGTTVWYFVSEILKKKKKRKIKKQAKAVALFLPMNVVYSRKWRQEILFLFHGQKTVKISFMEQIEKINIILILEGFRLL